MITTPRCGRPMRPKEIAGLPKDWSPSCGRPEGHTGACLSVQAWQRALEASRLREPGRKARHRNWRAERRARMAKAGPEAVPGRRGL